MLPPFCYLDFVMTLFLAFGVAFEIPVAVVLLMWIGAVNVKYMKKIRPYVVIGCFVAGMILTSSDIFSQTLLPVPMWRLFEVDVICSSMVTARGDYKDDENDVDELDHLRLPCCEFALLKGASFMCWSCSIDVSGKYKRYIHRKREAAYI